MRGGLVGLIVRGLRVRGLRRRLVALVDQPVELRGIETPCRQGVFDRDALAFERRHQAIEKLSDQRRGEPCVPLDAKTTEDFEKEKLTQLVGK